MDRSEPEALLFAATNPPATVSASVTLGGELVRIDLSSGVVDMTEAELGDEITVVAALARQHALAAQHVVVARYLAEAGHDGPATRAFLEDGMGLPNPESVLAARADLFTARYPGAD